MKTRKIFLAALCFICLFMCGCKNEIPEMTPQQNAQITQYAANLLLSHSKAYEGRLVDTSKPPEEKKERPVILPAKPDQEDAASAENTSEDASENENMQEAVIPDVQLPVEEVLGLQGFSISLAGFEVCDAYPNDTTAEEGAMFFAMTAAPGNKLLVLHIQVANTSGQEQVLNTVSLPVKYRILLNGADAHKTLVTMLDNDFAAQNMTLGAQEQRDTVLITEVSEELAAGCTSAALKVINGENETICR